MTKISREFRILPTAAALAFVLAGCSTSDPTDYTAPVGDKVKPVSSLYALADGCFAVKSASANAFIVQSSSGYAATAHDAASAEPFFLKATGLGRYLFYSHDSKLLTGDSSGVAPNAAATDGADWAFTALDKSPKPGSYTIAVYGTSQALATGSDGTLVLADAGDVYSFSPVSGCTTYPEMPIDIGATYKGPTRGLPVIGFAEVHSHMGMGSEMSDGAPQNHVGPSAGGSMYGQAMNRFGVVEALKDCKGMHGPDGVLSGENVVLDQNPTETHDTVGWPTFVGWPQPDSLLHQQMYWRWVERAYRAGLRIMTIHGTNIEALCNVAKAAGGNKDTSPMDEDCVDMSVGLKQVHYLYDIQNYIDAQNGGPGKGFFRIVKDPDEARAVIADGKLAVIPGLEFSNMFGCSVTFNPDGSETSGCTKEDIDRGVDDAWNKGVRQIIPFHDVDSALGGTGIFSFALNAVGWYGTHGFWKTYDCPDVPYFTGEGVYVAGDYGYSAGAAPLGFAADPLAQALQAAQGPLPLYPADKRQCNARGLTELGRYALQKIMDKGFVLDIDHAELSIKQDMLDMGAQRSPQYPLISAHGGHGGITQAQAQQILNQGGLIYPALPNGEDYVKFLKDVKAIWPAARGPLALGYGADSNGLRNLPQPRSAGFTPISYPFKLFEGPGWGPQYAAAGIKPITVGLLTIPESGKTWNPDELGTSHYGLVADFVEQVRIEGGQEATDALYNSAEAYLRMWEQTRASSGH